MLCSRKTCWTWVESLLKSPDLVVPRFQPKNLELKSTIKPFQNHFSIPKIYTLFCLWREQLFCLWRERLSLCKKSSFCIGSRANSQFSLVKLIWGGIQNSSGTTRRSAQTPQKKETVLCDPAALRNQIHGLLKLGRDIIFFVFSWGLNRWENFSSRYFLDFFWGFMAYFLVKIIQNHVIG